MVMLSKKNKTKKNKIKKNKIKKNKTKKNKIKKNKTKKNKYNQIGKGKMPQSRSIAKRSIAKGSIAKRSIAKGSIAKGSITKSKSTLKQTGRYDQKNLFQHLLEKVCRKRPSDKCRISFIEQNKGCVGINWGEHKRKPHGFVYLENFGKPIKEFGLECKLPKGIDAMFEGNRYLHFDFNLGTYCCKTEPPFPTQAKQWILEYGLPGVNDLGLTRNELLDLHNNLYSFIKNAYLFKNKELTAHTRKLKSKFEKFHYYAYKLKNFSEQFIASKEFDDFETQFFESFRDDGEYKNIYNHINNTLLRDFNKRENAWRSS